MLMATYVYFELYAPPRKSIYIYIFWENALIQITHTVLQASYYWQLVHYPDNEKKLDVHPLQCILLEDKYIHFFSWLM